MGALGLFVALQLLAADPAPTDTPTILLLRFDDQAGAEGEPLREQVAVYMRDLGIEVQSVGLPGSGTATTASADAAAAVRDRGARLAFWCDPVAADGTVTLHVVDAKGVAGRRSISRPRAEPDPSERHRAVALKLRAIVSGMSAIDAPPVEASAPPTAGEAGAARPTTTDATRAAAPPAIATSPPAPGPASSTAWTSRLSASVGYQLTVPSGLAPASHAVALEATWLVGRRLELVVASAFSPRATRATAAGEVALLDVPVRAGARIVGRWRPFELGAGAFASAHALSAHARDDADRRVDSWELAGGAGLDLVARARLGGPLLGELRAWGELPLPRTRFWVADQPVLDFGPRAGLTVGIMISGR